MRAEGRSTRSDQLVLVVEEDESLLLLLLLLLQLMSAQAGRRALHRGHVRGARKGYVRLGGEHSVVAAAGEYLPPPSPSPSLMGKTYSSSSRK